MLVLWSSLLEEKTNLNQDVSKVLFQKVLFNLNTELMRWKEAVELKSGARVFHVEGTVMQRPWIVIEIHPFWIRHRRSVWLMLGRIVWYHFGVGWQRPDHVGSSRLRWEVCILFSFHGIIVVGSKQGSNVIHIFKWPHWLICGKSHMWRNQRERSKLEDSWRTLSERW